LLNWYSEGESISDKDMEAAFMEHIGWNSRITTPYFVRAAEELSEKFGKYSDYVKGFTMSAPGFYGPQGRRLRTPLTYPDFVDKLHNFSYGGLRMSNIEMESSALAGLAALLGHRAATVCLVVANRYAKDMNTDYKGGMSEFIKKTLDVLTE
jgi:uridine phosphorylase